MNRPPLTLQRSTGTQTRKDKNPFVSLLCLVMQFRCVEASAVYQVVVVMNQGNHDGMWNQLSENELQNLSKISSFNSEYFDVCFIVFGLVLSASVLKLSLE